MVEKETETETQTRWQRRGGRREAKGGANLNKQIPRKEE